MTCHIIESDLCDGCASSITRFPETGEHIDVINTPEGIEFTAHITRHWTSLTNVVTFLEQKVARAQLAAKTTFSTTRPDLN